MRDVTTTRIWYAAYGSNLSLERFGCYLRGGRPAGGSRTYSGCRDTCEPLRIERTEIAAELAFGGTSQTWGGGVAFVDPTGEGTKARLYLITLEQFADVVAQENWLDPGSLEIALADESNLGDDLHYGRVLGLSEFEGDPVLTVTRHHGTQTARPSPAYLRYVASGLAESHELSPSEIATYLASKRGIGGEFTDEELLALLE
jgi:hypothetical protein